jgi:hypothetical protein
MAAFAAVALDEIPTLRFGGDDEPDWKPLRHHLGIGAFGTNAWVAARAGDPAIERHDEADSAHEELYLVLRGSARFTVDGEAVDAPAGTAVFVSDPAVTREAVATSDDTITLAVGAKRGEAFAPSRWESEWLERLGAA